MTDPIAKALIFVMVLNVLMAIVCYLIGEG